MDFNWAEMFTVENGIALLALTSLEIVLGIDNIVFISILVDRLPEHNRDLARRTGLLLALGMRILLLLTVGWIMKLQDPLFEVYGWEASGKSLILLAGGLFLIAKATHEIHGRVEAPDPPEEQMAQRRERTTTFAGIIGQIVALDIVFSLDSVITAVGMTENIPVMIVAVIIAIAIMLVFAGVVGRFVSRHPTIKMLALSFLILVGVLLTADAFHVVFNRGYVYFAMAFALGVELLNLRATAVAKERRELGIESAH